jgi:hypothetical protein
MRATLLLLLTLSCATRPAPWTGATPSTWPALQAALTSKRQAMAPRPWSARVGVTMHEPTAGHTIDARGAIAVAPGRAVRMILVGGAGATVLDAWVTPEKWRVAVPPVALVRRGGTDEPRDLPVGFLRWWFFRPLEGTVFAASSAPPVTTWLLRDGDAIVELREGPCDRGTLTTATRRVDGRAERIDECCAGASRSASDRVSYEDETTGLAVRIVLEAVAYEPPSEEAFADPDVGRSPKGTAADPDVEDR